MEAWAGPTPSGSSRTSPASGLSSIPAIPYSHPTGQSPRRTQFYQHVKEHIEYLHIKDALWDHLKGELRGFTFPGEGQGDVRAIVKDLLDNGYDGGISMEPHLAAVAHDKSVTSPDDIKYANYVEYGRRFMKLLEDIGHGDKIG